MKYNDPNQLNVFWDVPVVPSLMKPLNEYLRVQDKRNDAFANNKSLIRLQSGYHSMSDKAPWIIKKQSKTDTSHGWTYLQKYDTEQEAKDAYKTLLDSGDYVEG